MRNWLIKRSEEIILVSLFLVSFFRFRLIGGVDLWVLMRGLSLIGGIRLFLKRKKQFHELLDYWETWWTIGLILIATLSVVEVMDVVNFVKYWEKFLFGGWWFLVLGLLRDDNKFKGRMINVLGVTLIVRGLVELMLNWVWFSSWFVNLLSSSMARFTQISLLRGRTVSSMFIDSLVAVFVYWWLKGRRLVGIGGWLLVGLTTFLSNWRGRFLVFLTNSLLALKLWGADSWRWLGRLVVVMVVLMILLDRVKLARDGYSLWDRFLKPDDIEDVGSVKWRLRAFNESIEMGSSDLFGVGLGQFYAYTHLKSNMGRVYYRGLFLDDSSEHGPHNLFFQFLAELGWVGLGWLMIGLIGFAWEDLRNWGWNTRENRLISLLFWGVVLAVQFDPATSLEFFVLFFGLRGLLLK